MNTLSDTQRILLSTASTRDSGSLLPLPASLKPGGGVAKALDVLLNRGLAEERETDELAAARRTEDDVRFGMFVTAAGLAAIGVDTTNTAAGNDGDAAGQPPAPTRVNKSALVLDLLRRPDGAAITDLIAATGWLPHTTRAALTGLRKKGHELERFKRDGATCYRVAMAG